MVLTMTPYACGGEVVANGIDGNANPWVIGASNTSSDEGSPDPDGLDLEGGALDELRISAVRRTFDEL